MRYLIILLSLFVSAGCAMPSQARLYNNPDYQKRETLTQSLIKSDKSTLSEEAIQKMLTSKIVIANPAKLAIFKFEHSSPSNERYYEWSSHSYLESSEFIKNSQDYLSHIQKPLEETKRFSEITILPKMLMTESPSLVQMREAAALMQADLLLVYKTDSFLVTDLGFIFTKDKVNAYGSVEIVLLDIRTGIIPYAHVFDSFHEETSISGDKDVMETERRAEKIVTMNTLGKAADDLVKFLTTSSGK